MVCYPCHNGSHIFTAAHATHQNIYVIDHCLPFKDFVYETENKNSYK